MTNYIFQNKTKNILVIIFSALCIISNVYSQVEAYLKGRPIAVWEILNVLPYVIILGYLLTLDKQYAFKDFMFPAAFIIKALWLVYTTTLSTINYLDVVYGVQGLGTLLFSIASAMVMLVALIFAVIGSISGFKNYNFLKFGMIICMIMSIVNIGITILSLVFIIINFQKEDINGAILGTMIFSNIKSMFSTAIVFAFHFSVFNLCLNVKSNSKKKLFNNTNAQYQNQFEECIQPEDENIQQ